MLLDYLHHTTLRSEDKNLSVGINYAFAVPEGGSRHVEKSRLGHKHSRIFLLRQPRQMSAPPTGLNYPDQPQPRPSPMHQLVQKLHLSSDLGLHALPELLVVVTIFNPLSWMCLGRTL